MRADFPSMIYPAMPEPDDRAILRYAGMRGDAAGEILELLGDVKDELLPAIKAVALFRVYPLFTSGDELDLGFAKVTSRSLSNHLRGCTSVCVLLCTVGIAVDRYISKYERISPSKAHMASAVGTERVEASADSFSEFLRFEAGKRSLVTTPRFSPGYGDLPLSLEKDILGCLNAHKYAGVALTDAMLMSPTKTVSALIGLYRS